MGGAEVPRRVRGPAGRLVLRDGTRVKGYQVSFLDAGGMSAVYRGEKDGKTYILKEVPGDQPHLVMALTQEKSLLERLRHPGIVNYETIFEWEDHLYLVLEYIEGHVLGRTGQVPEEAQVVDWGLQLCDILEYLHAQDPPVIYRDLKPGNIMLEEGGRIRLIDFGIARLHKNDGRDSDTALLGSVVTASPEHYGGAQTDVRSDVYTLGATLYDLLAGGRRMNRGAFNFAPLRELNPSVSEHLEAVLERATRFDPEDRFQTIDELRQAMLTDCVTRKIPRAKSPRAHFKLVMAAALILGLLVAAPGLQGPRPSAETPPPAPMHLVGDVFSTRPDEDQSLVTLGEDLALFAVLETEQAKTIASRLNQLYHTECPLCRATKLEPQDIMVGKMGGETVLFHAHRHDDRLVTRPMLLATVTAARAEQAAATPRYLAGWWRDLTRDIVELSRGQAGNNSPLGESLRAELLGARRSLGPQASAENLARVIAEVASRKAVDLKDRFRSVPPEYVTRPDRFEERPDVQPLGI